MIATGTRAHWQKKRRAYEDYNGLYKGEWMETGDDPQLSPTVFMVEMPANSSTPPHFHRNNQFQVVVQGGGSIGPHALGEITVHYAGAFTGYGPLAAGDKGLSYITLRPVFETGAQWIPGKRDQMVRGPKLQTTSHITQPMPAAALMALQAVQSEDLFGNQAEPATAPVARLYRLPPQATLAAPSPEGSDGQFYLVTGGSMAHQGQQLLTWEQLFVSADESGFEIQAGEGGLEVLLLQFPLKAQPYIAAAAASAAGTTGTGGSHAD